MVELDSKYCISDKAILISEYFTFLLCNNKYNSININGIKNVNFNAMDLWKNILGANYFLLMGLNDNVRV